MLLASTTKKISLFLQECHGGDITNTCKLANNKKKMKRKERVIGEYQRPQSLPGAAAVIVAVHSETRIRAAGLGQSDDRWRQQRRFFQWPLSAGRPAGGPVPLRCRPPEQRSPSPSGPPPELSRQS
ncbi:hypothetical protein MTO96_049381 [Rhipicephalus appendiculatus]